MTKYDEQSSELKKVAALCEDKKLPLIKLALWQAEQINELTTDVENLMTTIDYALDVSNDCQEFLELVRESSISDLNQYHPNFDTRFMEE